MPIGKYTRGRFRHGSVRRPGWRKSDPHTGDTQHDKHKTRLSVPCDIGWVNSPVQTALQIMPWMGWSNMSLILLELSCFNRPSFHNPLIHHLFASTSQWSNIAIIHYYILNLLAVSTMTEAISLARSRNIICLQCRLQLWGQPNSPPWFNSPSPCCAAHLKGPALLL